MSNPFDAFDKPIETSLEDQTPNLMTGPGVSVAAVDPEAEALKTQAADWFNLSAQQERFHGLMSAFGRELEGHPAYNFPSIEEYTPNAFDQFDPPKPQPFNIGGILGSDIQRGLGTALEMQGAGMRQYGLPGASVIERGGQTQQERAGEGAGPQSVFDIKSAKDVGQWFGRNVLEGLGTSLPTIGAGIAGTVTGGPLAGFAAVQGSSNLLGVGQARLALEREQDMLLRKAERAAQLGQWELRSQIQQEVAQLDPQKHEALILAAGAIIGGLESVAPWMTMLKESPLSLPTAVRGEVVRYIMGHLAKRAGTGAIQEGVTEALQSVAEVVTIAKAKGAKAAYDYLKAINDNRYKILDEALAGAAGGAGLGGVGGMRDAALAYRRRDRVGEQTEGEGAAPTGQPSVPSAGGVELPEGFQLPQGQTSTETVSREAPSTVTTPQMPDADQAVALWRAAQTGEAVDETVTPAVEDGASQTEALVAALPEDQQAEVVPLIEQAEAANPGVTDRIAEAIAPVEDAEQAADPAAQVPNEVQAELERLGIAQARTEDEVRQIIADQQRAVKAAEIARNEAQAATAQNLKGYLDQGGSLARSAYPQIAKAAGVSVQQVPQVLEAAASQGLLRKTSAGEFRRMLPQPTALGAVETIQQLAREMAPILPRGTVVRSFQELADLPTNVRGGLADLTGPVAAGQARPVVSQASGGPVDAFAQDGAIYIAGYAMNPQGRMSHEALHALVTAGVVEQGEIKILADRARKVGAFSKTREAQYERDYRKRYPTDWKRRLDEEAAAHLIEARANGADHGRRINAIVDRILQFVERLGNMLRRQGFRSANDVADAFFSGEMARRERVDAWMRENGASQQAHTGEPPVSGFPTLKDGKMFAIRAFHGSPHDFDKFDMSRIGTGEGAQAYGHGLYFAESPAVAHEYRATLSDTSLGNVIRLDGQRLADSPLSWLANGHLSSDDTTLAPIMARMDAANRSDTARIAELRKLGGRQANLMIPDIERHIALRAAQIKQLSDYDGSGVLSRVEPGRMYEVRINAEPEQFLDWDKPPSAEVLSAVNRAKAIAGSEIPLRMKFASDFERGRLQTKLSMLDEVPVSGRDAYDLMRVAIGDTAASQALRNAGIPGIRYLDAGSRGTGDGSRNYVVFDDSLIEIVAKDGQPVTPQERADVTQAMTPGEPDAGTPNKMFALADRDTGQSMRRDLDALGYYSGALEAAKSWPQKKGTPEQAIAWLKKSGVKDAEIEATGVGKAFEGQKSVSKDDLASFLTENRVGMREVVRERQFKYPYTTADEWERAIAVAEQRGDWDEAARLTQAWEEGDGVGGGDSPKWQAYSLDPSNPTYRETVLHLPVRLDDLQARKDALMAEVKTRPGEARLREINDELFYINNEVNARNAAKFQSGHFPEPNIIGHMMTSMVKHEGRPVYLIDQIQSDWGQKLRDGGVRDEAKIAELKAASDAASEQWRAFKDEAAEFARSHGSEPNDFASTKAALMVLAKKSNVDEAVQGAENRLALWDELLSEHNRLRAEYETASGASPGNPLVNTTDQWTTTTLRRAIRQAAEADADYIAIPSGDTVLSYNPGDTDGMRGFYDGIVPKNLRNILRKLDKATPDPIRTDKLETPTAGMKGDGFTIFPLTDTVKTKVKTDGQAMFAFRDEPKTPGLDMSKEARMKRAQEMGFDTGTVWYHGTASNFDEPSGALWVTPDRDVASAYGDRASLSKALDEIDDPDLLPEDGIDGVDMRFVSDVVDGPLEGQSVLPLLARGKDLDLTQYGDTVATANLVNRLKELGIIRRDEPLENFTETTDGGVLWKVIDDLGLVDDIKRAGFDSVTIKDVVSTQKGQRGHVARLIFDPRNIRSVNAAFDPANADSPNLMFAFRDEPKTPGLDMSKDARMKRAHEMGFDTGTVYYHGSPMGPFESFDPARSGTANTGNAQLRGFFFTPDQRYARSYAETAPGGYIGGKPYDVANPLHLAAVAMKATDGDADRAIANLQSNAPTSRRASRAWQSAVQAIKRGDALPEFDDTMPTGHVGDYFLRMTNPYRARGAEMDTLSTLDLQRRGFDGVIWDGGKEVVVFDPRNIRSVNAAFDPANADSPNLMFAFRGEDQPQANQGPAASLQSIVSDLAMDLGLTIRQGMRTAAAKAARRSGLQGLYDPRTGIIRVGSVADLSTVAQSAGDAIRHRFGAAIDQLIATNARDLARGAVATSAPTLKDTGYSGLDLDIEVQDAAIQAAIDKTQKPALDRMIGTATANAILKDVAGVARQGERDSFTSYLNNLAQRRDELTREMEAIRNRQAMPGPASANARSEIDRRMRELAQVMTLIRDGETRQARLEQSVLEDVTQRVRERFSETGTPKTPEAPSEQQLAQGYRQWFGDYLLSPEKARQDAPDFTSDLEAFLDAQDPVLLAKLEDSQAAIDAYFKSDPAALVEAMVRDATKANRWERFQEDRQRWGLGGALSLRASSFYTATIDTANPFAVAVKEALRIYERNNNTKLDLDTGANAYKLARLAPHSHAWATRDMERGIRDRRTNEHDGPGLIQALTTALGSNRAEAIDVGEGSRYRKFGSYLVARYAALEWERFANGEKDRAPTVQPPGTTDALSVAAWYGQVAASLEQQFPAFVDAAEQVYDYQQNLLKLQRDAGFISAETYDQLVTDRTYVPFYRHFDEDELSAGRTLGGGGAGGILKRKRGSDRDVIDPIASIAQKTFETRHLIAQNDVKRALIQLAEAAGPGGGVIAERIEPKQLKAMAIDVERVVNDAAREAGVDTQDRASLIDLMQQVLGNDAVTQYYSQRTIQPGKLPITFFWENGELQAMQLGDGEHGHKLASQMMDVLNTFGKTHLDWLIKFAQIPAQTLRIGITTHPEFAVANIIRDALMAFQYDPKALPLWTQLKGMVDVVRGADYVQAYYANAGMMGGEATAALDKLRNERDIRALVGRGYKFKVFDSLSNMLSHADELFEARNWKDRVSGGVVGAVAGAATAGPVGAMAGSVIGTLVGGKAIVQVGEVSETATRARLYKHGFDRAKAQGLDDVAAAQEAAFWAHDYTDYSRRGSRMDGWAKVIPFLNANLQGNDIYIRRLFGKGDQSWNPGIMYPAYRLGLLDINKLSPKEQQELGLSAWTWAMSTLVLGSLSAMIALAWDDDERLKDIDDRVKSSHWLIPVDNDIILRIPKPFQTVWLSQAIERYVTEARHGNERFLEHYLDDLWNTWKPPVVPSIAELGATFTGYDINSGREVIPSWMRDQPRNLQYTAYTSDFAKWAGGQINVAPMYVDHVIQKFGASWGRTFLNLNIPGSAWYNPGKPTKGPEEEFIGRRFLWRVGRGSEAGKMIREMMGSEDPLPKIWGAIAQPISYYAARANEIRQMIEKPVPDHAKAVERLTQLPADERAYAILETYFRGRNEAKYRMLHPMNRAEKIARETIALEKMLIGGELLTGRKGKDQKEVPLPPSEKKAARDILTQLRMMEGHNALVIMEEPGWKGRMMFDTASVMAELKQASPATYKELTTRYGKSGIVSDSGIRYVWPEVKSRLEDQRWLEWVRKNRVAGQSGMLAGAWAKAQISRRPAVEAAPSNP